MGEMYLKGCGELQREDILRQVELTQKLRIISQKLKKVPKSTRDPILKKELQTLKFQSNGVTLPLGPGMRVNGIIVEKCRALDSFTVPLWLVFTNAEEMGEPFSVIYKVGDDLRQDALTLQLLSTMDRVWKEAGLDLQMSVYGVVATGLDEGFIHVVPHSKTAAELQKSAGGATAVFAQDTIANWLQQHNPTPHEYQAAVTNFMYSCAGYCVACYVLGIADRHNDNIMFSTSGHMFHIDFAHFLGNVLRWGPINRDKAPFVLTPEMAYVMGGRDSPQFKHFTKLCCYAYNILRKHTNLLLTLLSMMISSGIPQLKREEDLGYITNALQPELTNKQAAKLFKALIYKSLDTKTTRLNFAAHLLAHRE